MNVTCNKCGKRYVIADQKVDGKAAVKIRCKQCQNLIAVSVSAPPAVGPSASGDPAAGGSDDEKTRAATHDDSSAWFAMIGGKQTGPFDLYSLASKVSGGEVTLRTHLWKNGMAEWKRASEVPEVSQVFAGISVGATATGPTQAGPETKKPRAPAAQRDVATALEVPSPEITSRRVGTPQPQPGLKASELPQAPLGDLFSDVQPVEPLQGRTLRDPTGKHVALADPQADAKFDPFAALASPSDGELPPPGEATRFFIAQAGVNKRNPPWKIALFVGGFIGVPAGLLYLLSTLDVLPTVTRTTADGKVVQESFFSAGGMSGLKDMLSGEAKRKKAEAERQEKERAALAVRQKVAQAQAAARVDRGEKADRGDGAGTVESIDFGSTKPTDPSLAAFYAEDVGKKGIVPKVRKDDATAAVMNTGGGLSQEAIGKVVADKLKSFEGCIDAALRRTPNLSVGNITVILNVAGSGVVKSAAVEPKKHEGADWAQCMMSAGKRIIFPSSEGETEVQLPFKVGVSIAP